MDATPTVPASPAVLHFFKEYSGYLILGHREPDGDCVGSQLALASALDRAGKRVVVANPGPFERPEIVPFATDFTPDIDIGSLGSNPAAVVLDCSSADRLGDLADRTRDLPILVIDHHTSGAVFGDVHFIEPQIPATTILVTSLISQLGYTVTPHEAFLLFLGLATDTGFFRFLGTGETTAFRTATALIEAGASPREIDYHIRNGRSFESRKLISRMLDRVERLQDGRILLTYQTRADERELGSRRDSDALYSLLLAIEDVEMIAVAKEKPDGCTVSFRATSEIDVGALATEFGGGGHEKASGAFVPDNLDTFLTGLRARLNALA